MDPNRFDALSRALVTPGSRRATLRALLGTLLGGALLGPSPDARTAAPKTKTKTKTRTAAGRGGNGRGRPAHDRHAGQEPTKTKQQQDRQQGTPQRPQKQRHTQQRPEPKADAAPTGEPVPEAAAPARGEVAGEEVTAASHGCGHTGTACSAGDACCSGICSDARGTCCLAKGKRCMRGAQCCSGRCNRKTRRCRGCPSATTKPCQGDCIPKERCCTGANCSGGQICPQPGEPCCIAQGTEDSSICNGRDDTRCCPGSVCREINADNGFRCRPEGCVEKGQPCPGGTGACCSLTCGGTGPVCR